MSNKITDIKNYRKDRFYDMNYLDLNMWKVLQYILLIVHSRPMNSIDGRAPDAWNPILYCCGVGQFDPNMMDGSQSEDLRTKSRTPWVPWPTHNGLKRTKLYIEKYLDYILEPSHYKRIPAPMTAIYNQIEVAQNHFLYTKEILSENEIIINICYMATKKYKRVHIKDYKKAIKLLFNRTPHNIITCKPRNLDVDNLKKIIVDGSHIEIQDESVEFILSKLEFLNSKTYDFISA